MNGKKVLVTGGLGNVGSKITDYLSRAGYEVFVLTRKEKNIIPNINYKSIEADITNLLELEEKLDFEIDFCVHLASFNESFEREYAEKALKINTLGTRNILEVCKMRSVSHFIYFSTFHVYGVANGIVDESWAPQPINDYALTHLFAEYYIKQFGCSNVLPFTILRLTNSYGCPTFLNTNKWYLVLNDLTKSAFEHGKIFINGNGQAKRDFIFMGDVALVVDKLLNTVPHNAVYNLSSGKTYTISEIADSIKEIYKEKYFKSIDIHKDETDITEYKDLLVSNNKLKNVVQFEPRDRINAEVGKIFDLLEMKNDAF